jgi:hypothetical protein
VLVLLAQSSYFKYVLLTHSMPTFDLDDLACELDAHALLYTVFVVSLFVLL